MQARYSASRLEGRPLKMPREDRSSRKFSERDRRKNVRLRASAEKVTEVVATEAPKVHFSKLLKPYQGDLFGTKSE